MVDFRLMIDRRAFSPQRSAPPGGLRSHPDVVALEQVSDDRESILPFLDKLLRPTWAEYHDAVITVEQVPLRRVLPVASVVQEQRLARTRELTKRFLRSGIAPFGPALVRVGNDC